MQNADVVAAITRPDILGITKYGPEKFAVNKGLMVMHLLKNRYGTQDMLFFQEDLKYFRIKEASVPPTVK